MSIKDDEFLQRLLTAFQEEANEHIRTVTTGLLDLERMPTAEDRKGIVEVVFREVHSLKGAARSVNLTDIETVCRSLEDFFASLKQEKLALVPTLFDLLHRAMDLIDLCLRSSEGIDPGHILDLVRQLEFAQAEAEERQAVEERLILPAQPRQVPESRSPKLEAGNRDVSAPAVPEVQGTIEAEGRSPSDTLREEQAAHFERSSQTALEKPGILDSMRIPTRRLDSLFLGSEEMLSAKLMADQHVSELRRMRAMIELWHKKWSRIYPEIRAARLARERKDSGNREKQEYGNRYGRDGSLLQSAGLLEFLDWTQEHIASVEKGLTDLTRCAENDYRSISAMVDTLLGGMKSVMMLPFSTLLEVFPKMVRDLARDQSKEVQLRISGDKIEVHKRVLELLKDPLIHLVRNCVDHGIEKPEARNRSMKPPRGSITIAVSNVSGHGAEIVISDDGAGVDVEKVKKAAIKRGFLSEAEAGGLAEKEARALIFQSEVSTSPIISDLSGRGLGLAIAREKVEELGGTITVESAPGAGTSFKIRFPVTIATFRGVLARVEEQVFVIPTLHVERSLGIKRSQIRTVGNKEAIALDSATISLIRLGDVLKIPRIKKNGKNSDAIDALVLCDGHKRIAFSVDEVIGEQEVLIKNLGRQLSRVRNVAGATVLGSGRLVLVLHVRDLMKYAAMTASGKLTTESVGASVEKSVLVVEDSITSRILLKNILETAGYRVKTAVDGLDALTALKTEPFDLVVSDVDMPRMNGFELTARIRSDTKPGDLPVVLVTALGSREDRERGIDAGANAYIVKSSFDQSNLLEVVRRLI